MTHRWIVTALGKDRPGIVAGVTKVLYRLGCNLEDSAMTRLEGEFAIMLIFSSPSRINEQMLRRSFKPLEHQLKLVTHLKALTTSETSVPSRRGKIYSISIYGADRSGIVFHVADALARAGVNITDVHTHRSTGKGPSLYLLLLEVELSSRIAVKPFETRLKKLGKSLGVHVSLRPSETAIL